MIDSTASSNESEKTSPSTSTEPLEEFARRVGEKMRAAGKGYGNNPGLLVKEHPECDRRIDRTYHPKPIVP